MKHLNLKHFKQLLLSLMALACVTTAYAQDANYDDFCKPTPVSKGGRIQIKGEILNATQLQENSPKTFTPTASSNNVQEWANTENEILAYPGAKFDLKVNFKPRTGFGSLTVFQLRSDETPSSTNRLYGLFKGDWQHMIDKRNETSNDKIDTESLFMEIEEANLSGVSVEYTINDKNAATSATFPISIPENISAGQFVVIRFLICNITDSGSFDYTTEYDPCTSKASQVNYCDYIVRIVEQEPQGLKVTWEQPENGTITVKNGAEVLQSPAYVEPGTKLTIVPAPVPGRYELGTLTANDTPIKPDRGRYEITITENTVIAATFDIAKYQINLPAPNNGTIKVVYADNETQEVADKSKVQLGTKLKVIAEPSTSDYVLNRLYYVYGLGDQYDITKGDNGYVFTVQETTNNINAIYIYAEFEKVVKYRITWAGEETMQGNSLKVVYADTDEEVLNSETLVTEGSVLKIIPTAVAGYHLSALSYTISGLQNVPFTIGNEPYTFTVEGGTEDPKMGYFVIISAEFTPDTYTLTTSVNPAEGGSVNVTTTDGATIQGSVTYGQTIVVSASANDRYELQSLEVKGATEVDGQEGQYTVEEDVTVTATFELKKYTVTWSAENGTLDVKYIDENEQEQTVTSGVTKIPAGSTIRVVPTSDIDNGYIFKSLSYQLGSESPVALTEEPYEFILNDNATLNVKFGYPSLNWSTGGLKVFFGILKVSTPDNANLINVNQTDGQDGSVEIPANATVTVLATVREDKIGYIEGNVYINDEKLTLNEDAIGTFVMPAKGTVLKVTFDEIKYSYNVTKEGEGDVQIKVGNSSSGASAGQIAKDNIFSVIATPKEGWKLKSIEVKINDEVVTGEEFKATDDIEINVVFEIITYTVNITQPEEGAIISVKVKDGKDIENGAIVEYGTELEISIETETGYKVKYLYVGTSPQDAVDGKYYFIANRKDVESIDIRVELEMEKYALTIEDIEGIDIAVKVQGEGGIVKPGSKAVQYGQVLEISAAVEEGYILKSLLVNGNAVEKTDDKYTHTVDGNVTISAVVETDLSSINGIKNGTVYYNAAEEVLYTGNAVSVRVYDLSGRLVLNADSQETVSLAQLADGVYTAVVDNVVLKLKK